MQSPSTAELPRSLAIGLPIFVIFGLLVIDLTMPDGEFRETWIDSERGLIENLTALLALLGCCFALIGVSRARRLNLPWLAGWCGFFALGFFYLASEEASWGQHWVSWETPAWLTDLNRYGEANLHNISHSADRIPKTIVGGCIVIIGIGWPLYRVRLEAILPAAMRWMVWILPSRAAMPMAMSYFVMWLINRTFVALDFNQRAGDGFAGQEQLELLMSTYLFLYIVALVRRLKQGLSEPTAATAV